MIIHYDIITLLVLVNFMIENGEREKIYYLN